MRRIMILGAMNNPDEAAKRKGGRAGTVSVADIKRAEAAIRGIIRETRLIRSRFYSKLCSGDVYLKLENEQPTGTFKVRGALNKLRKLSAKQRAQGIVAASGGNHGRAVAWFAQRLGIKATIFVPESTPEEKINETRKYGADVEVQGAVYDGAERAARKFGKECGAVFISPYNDADIIAGAGTIGLEIMRQRPDVDIILVPVGGGALISGIAIAAKAEKPKLEVIGAQSTASPVMHASLKAGKVVDVKLGESIAEGLHGGIEKDTITFPLIQKYADDILLVEEADIRKAIKQLFLQDHVTAEGSGAVGPAAIIRYPDRFAGKKVVVVISGGAIEKELLSEIIHGR